MPNDQSKTAFTFTVLGEWHNWGKSTSPASLYLEYDKLKGWLASSDRVIEAATSCQMVLRSFLKDSKEDLVAKLTGKGIQQVREAENKINL